MSLFQSLKKEVYYQNYLASNAHIKSLVWDASPLRGSRPTALTLCVKNQTPPRDLVIMKKISLPFYYLVCIGISSSSYADPTWYTLRPDPDSAAIDGFHWRKKCTPEGYGWGYDTPSSMINGYKNDDNPDYSLSVKDIKEGGIVVQTTITRIYKKNKKFNEVTTWYRGKERCEKFSLKERMAIEREIEKEKQKRAKEKQESQQVIERYK